jgi:hypothetical protein
VADNVPSRWLCGGAASRRSGPPTGIYGSQAAGGTITCSSGSFTTPRVSRICGREVPAVPRVAPEAWAKKAPLPP